LIIGDKKLKKVSDDVFNEIDEAGRTLTEWHRGVIN
jgi:hypothetical protein